MSKPQLDMIKVSCSPLSNRIQLYRMGRRSTDTALETKDVTTEALIAVIEHLMATPNKGITFKAKLAGGRRVKYTLSVVEEELTENQEE